MKTLNNLQLIWNISSSEVNSLLISMESTLKAISLTNYSKCINLIFENSWPNISELMKIKSLCNKYKTNLVLSYIEYKDEFNKLINLFNIIKKISNKKSYLIKINSKFSFYKKELFEEIVNKNKHIYVKNSNFWAINSDFFRAILQDNSVSGWTEQLKSYKEFDFLNLLKLKGCDNWSKNEDLYGLLNEDLNIEWNKYNVYSAILYDSYEKMANDWTRKIGV